MFLTRIAAVTIGLALVVLSNKAVGHDGTDPHGLDEKKPRAAKNGADSHATDSRQAVDNWLKDVVTGQSVPPKTEAVDDEAIRSLFPDDRFYAVRFMRYPRAVKPPSPLKLENLVRVRPDKSVERIENLDALKKLLEAKLATIPDENTARVALRASLRLAEEFYQDGYYTFTIPEQSISVAKVDGQLVASGKAEVTKGGKGSISVKLTTGGPSKVAIEGSVRPDVRNR
jgi:hypothetical protein